ncbi:MAG: ThiF family adenylyltransferase [Spirochaetaceae bacterium]|nr:ThiF family adenylyltransferase [Spirochaetaceae bacterium]
MGLFERTDILVGQAGRQALQQARIAIYGLGGVGAACAMDLVRMGVGHFYVVDFDLVEESNLNRLYFGYLSTVGKPKADAFADFARDINPDVEITARKLFFSGEEAASIVDDTADLHADCIDSLNAKVCLLEELSRRKALFIASMGTAGRMQPERLRLGSIWETRGCPLAKSVRTRLRKREITADFPVVWSDEPPVKPIDPVLLRGKSQVFPAVGLGILDSVEEDGGEPCTPSGRVRMVQGSGPFVPQAAGHIMASWIARQILEKARRS